MKRKILFFLLFYVSANTMAKHALKNNEQYCMPNEACWPTPKDWQSLSHQVGDRLIKVTSVLEACQKDSHSTLCKQQLEKAKDPLYLQSQAGATQITGWLNGWQYSTSAFAVAAENSNDIAQAVLFAKKHHLKLVIKGTGHDYLGRSSAPNSLLVWTHNMRTIKIDDHFKTAGCDDDNKGEPAVTMGAGTRWIEAFKAVVVDHGRYVQGGGCATVGAAGGFIQGGGYGSFSKKFGTGSASILQAEVVTAQGQTLTVNRCQNADLFWALKGGGAGTFAIVSNITVKTHDLPENFGMVNGTIQAKTDRDFKELILQFVNFYYDKLKGEHWGEALILQPNNQMNLEFLFQGLNKEQAEATWHDFVYWIKERPNQYKLAIQTTVIPARKFWDYDYREKYFPKSIMTSKNKKIPREEFWWREDQSEVLTYISYYKSRYIPLKLFDRAHSQQFSDALFKASRLLNVPIIFNIGLGGGSTEARLRQKETSMHPGVNDAAALLMISELDQYVFPDIKGMKPNKTKAEANAKIAQKAAGYIYKLTRDAGTYVNEADYFEPDWQKAFWGTNYPKLLAIKKQVDPDGLFSCHHCVGSELKNPVSKTKQ